MLFKSSTDFIYHSVYFSGNASWKLTPNLSCTHANSRNGGIEVLGISIAPSFLDH